MPRAENCYSGSSSSDKNLWKRKNNKWSTKKQHLKSSISVQLVCWGWSWRLSLKLDLSTDEVQGVLNYVEVPGWGMEGRSGTSETCDSWVDQAKGDLTADEAESAAVWLVMLLRYETCKFLEGNRGRRIPTSTCGQDQRSKGTILKLQHKCAEHTVKIWDLARDQW